MTAVNLDRGRPQWLDQSLHIVFFYDDVLNLKCEPVWLFSYLQFFLQAFDTVFLWCQVGSGVSVLSRQIQNLQKQRPDEQTAPAQTLIQHDDDDEGPYIMRTASYLPVRSTPPTPGCRPPYWGHRDPFLPSPPPFLPRASTWPVNEAPHRHTTSMIICVQIKRGIRAILWPRGYLLHLLCADWLVGVCFQVRYMWRVVRCRGGASVFAALRLTGCVIRRVVQAVVVQHGDHFLFDQLLRQLEVWQRFHGGGTEDWLVDLPGWTATNWCLYWSFYLKKKKKKNWCLYLSSSCIIPKQHQTWSLHSFLHISESPPKLTCCVTWLLVAAALFCTAAQKNFVTLESVLPQWVWADSSEQQCDAASTPSLFLHRAEPVTHTHKTEHLFALWIHTHTILHIFVCVPLHVVSCDPLTEPTCLRASTSAASSVKPTSVSVSSSSFSAFSGRTISKSFLGTGSDISPCLSCCRLSFCCVKKRDINDFHICQHCFKGSVASLQSHRFSRGLCIRVCTCQVFGKRRVSQLLLTVNIQLVSQWSAAGS